MRPPRGPHSGMSIERLKWDSEFFGFGVGRLVGEIESENALRDALAAGSAQGLTLIYGECAGDDERAHEISLACGGRFVDTKRTYTVPLQRSPLPPVEGIVPVSDANAYTRRQLRQLAWQSAVFSRYRVDPNMPPGSWRRMYAIWIERSVQGELADAVLVATINANDRVRIAGMVTVSHRGDEGSIGLLAVDARWRRGGIGSRLLCAAASWCAERRCAHLSVVTQGDNVVLAGPTSALGMPPPAKPTSFTTGADRDDPI